MKNARQPETQVLSAIAFVCYSTTLAAMLVLGYLLLALQLRVADLQSLVVTSYGGL